MPPLYPLRFEPFLRRLPWGGRRLESVLGKRLPPGDDYAESWEIADHELHHSRVAAGPLAGWSLERLVAEHGPELLGRHWPQEHFPLLLKFLDAHSALSVQVHPDDAHAATFSPAQCGKSEVWMILAAEPGSVLYAGLKRGVDRLALQRAIAAGEVVDCLHAHRAEPGDCFWLPAGTVHALGAGVMVAELQQPSDCTFRLFDWGRRDANGQPRALHIDEALAAIHFEFGPVEPVVPQPTRSPQIERLVSSEQFVLERWRLSRPEPIGGDAACRVLAVISGTIEIAGEGFRQRWATGTTALVPANSAWSLLPIEPPAVALVGHLP